MRIATSLAALLLASAPAIAFDEGAPVRFRPPEIKTILLSSTKPMHLKVGDNPLHRQRQFVCNSTAGCIVVTSASIMQSGDRYGLQTCSLVDGQRAAPGCYPNDINPILIQQQMHVGQGEHTIDTVVTEYGKGATVTGWEVQYTLYEQPN
jgi:hypothetical protein